MSLVMVLEDGETFSRLDGCRIVRIPEGIEGDDIDSVIADGDYWDSDANEAVEVETELLAVFRETRQGTPYAEVTPKSGLKLVTKPDLEVD